MPESVEAVDRARFGRFHRTMDDVFKGRTFLRARNRQQTGTNLGLPPQGWLPASYLQRSTCRCKGAADESLAEQVHTEMRPWAHQNMGASAVATGDAPVATLFMCAVRLAEQSAYRDAPVATPYMFMVPPSIIQMYQSFFLHSNADCRGHAHTLGLF